MCSSAPAFGPEQGYVLAVSKADFSELNFRLMSVMALLIVKGDCEEHVF